MEATKAAGTDNFETGNELVMEVLDFGGEWDEVVSGTGLLGVLPVDELGEVRSGGEVIR